MPRIVVIADEPTGTEQTVLMKERVVPSDLESDHFSAQLIERVGWAVLDANEVEQRSREGTRTSEATRNGSG
jgi:hypothetical protein